MQEILPGTVTALHTVTTGWGEQHPEHRFGSRLPALWWILTSRRWIKVPITATLIEHRDGLVLFDTGLDPAIASDPGYITSPIGRFLLHRIFRLHIGPGDALNRQLEGLGFAASDVTTVVFSHLHFDHVGGIRHVPQAELLVSDEEWQILSQPHPEYEWILREHIEVPGANWRPIRFEPTDDPVLAPFGVCYDVLGDRSMVLLPTPGHTPGSLSMLVRSPPFPPILLIGDLTYKTDLLMNDQVPGTGDASLLRASFAKVRDLKALLPKLVIVAAHDTEAAKTLRAAQL